ncbi:MAG TPA: SufD family Fe-S cluster assembly protein [Candidatus Scatosoma pullistercoris]|uniref:SufD family Fe-S cluster assembly protein n=1 Tax=Candidatus Scatosoma pullistercoris TaxID=2840934 RepID=A0A9D1ME61_9FIRM|nr:SufD family Fe-S cluster assembly protein [Candidatus Scatosoma pullistercoris]
MDAIEKDLLLKIADLHGVPEGAYNIRENGESAGRSSTANIEILSRKDGKAGIDVFIRPGTKNESVHIPVILSKAGWQEMVYNDFYIGDGADVLIVAGCGIHNCGGVDLTSRHDGIHTFYLGRNARVKYVEKHYGEGDGNGENVMNPTTVAHLAEGAHMEMETTQIKGIDSTNRVTRADLKEGAELIIREKIYTHGKQKADTDFMVDMNGAGASADVISRSVAAGNSRQHFVSTMNGNAPCHGHTECDAIIMDKASVTAAPCLSANDIDAELIHEAAIGKIAGEQLIKLMTLGLTEKEAEEQIIKGFLH